MTRIPAFPYLISPVGLSFRWRGAVLPMASPLEIAQMISFLGVVRRLLVKILWILPTEITVGVRRLQKCTKLQTIVGHSSGGLRERSPLLPQLSHLEGRSADSLCVLSVGPAGVPGTVASLGSLGPGSRDQSSRLWEGLGGQERGWCYVL